MHYQFVWLLSMLLIFGSANATLTVIEDTQLKNLVQQLATASYQQKSLLVKDIANTVSHHKRWLLECLADNQLYRRKQDGKVFVIANFSVGGKAQSVLDTETIVIKDNRQRRSFKKIGVNNSVRRTIRSAMAQLMLKSSLQSERLAAAQQLLTEPGEISRVALAHRLTVEADAQVTELLRLVSALKQLQSEDSSQRIQAIKAMQRSLYPPVKLALLQHQKTLQAQLPEYRQEYLLLQQTLQTIEQLQQLNAYAKDLYFGLSLGAVLLLAAIGLAITFGVMGVINMAHGEMIMLGAYTTYVIQQCLPDAIGISLLVAIPAAFVVSGAVGVLIERSVIRHLYGRPLETLLATFGISLILQQAVRSLFGPLNQEVMTPQWMAGSFMLNPGLELTWNRLYILVFSLIVLATLALVMKRTLFGLQMRAVTMNRPMASSMGIKTGWVDALTFGLGSGIAGIAGVALSQLTNVGPNLGQAYIIDSFMVVVFGGVGNLWGTLVAAMSLGVANKLFEPIAGAVLAKILVLVFIILFIQKRPRGLFALKGRAVEG